MESGFRILMFVGNSKVTYLGTMARLFRLASKFKLRVAALVGRLGFRATVGQKSLGLSV